MPACFSVPISLPVLAPVPIPVSNSTHAVAEVGDGYVLLRYGVVCGPEVVVQLARDLLLADVQEGGGGIAERRRHPA
jgi:hypothetical protein